MSKFQPCIVTFQILNESDAIYKMPINSSHLFSIMLRNITANDVLSDNGKLLRQKKLPSKKN
jgi:hypothetical protein